MPLLGGGAPKLSERGPPKTTDRTSSANTTTAASLIRGTTLAAQDREGISGQLSSLSSFWGGGSGAGVGSGLLAAVELFRERDSNPTILSFTDPTFDPTALVPDLAAA